MAKTKITTKTNQEKKANAANFAVMGRNLLDEEALKELFGEDFSLEDEDIEK